jgi:hypothetical protein
LVYSVESVVEYLLSSSPLQSMERIESTCSPHPRCVAWRG